MHELSLAMEVIELTQQEAAKNKVSRILEIQIEVGDLSGVEADAFQSALEMLLRETMLENATVILIRTPGKGKCFTCQLEFDMKMRLDTCPKCACFPSEIAGGEEFRVISILVQ